MRSKDEDFLDLSVDIEQNTSLTHCLRFGTTEPFIHLIVFPSSLPPSFLPSFSSLHPSPLPPSFLSSFLPSPLSILPPSLFPLSLPPSLFLSLRTFSTCETLSAESKYYCEQCCSKQEATKRLRVKKLPKILALHLKRFKYMEQLHRYTKLSHRVVFPWELKLFNTVSSNQTRLCRFRLVGKCKLMRFIMYTYTLHM